MITGNTEICLDVACYRVINKMIIDCCTIFILSQIIM